MGTPSTINPLLRSVLSIVLLFAAVLTARGQAAGTASIVPATAVPLALPVAIAYDTAGDLYIAEANHHVIRRVDTAGRITTVAGTGEQGFSGDGGSALSATLDSPTGIAVDPKNNLYIADTHNDRIRLIDGVTGNISSVAGTGHAGFSGDGGNASAAQLRLPGALALDSLGNLYIADTGNHRIRRLSPEGILTTVAGNGVQGFSGDNGLATAASIDSPAGIALDSAGQLYISDTHNHRLRVVDRNSGVIRTLTGDGTPSATGDGGLASSARFAMPRGLTIDAAGNIFIADSQNHRVRRVDTITGIITTVAGNGTEQYSGDAGPAVSASLDTPRAAALSPDKGLTIADTLNGRIRQLTTPGTSGTSIQTIAGLGSNTPGTLSVFAPSVVAYGGGLLIASIASSSSASGSVNFLRITSGGSTLLGTVPFHENIASLSTGTLSAGQYSLMATYPGDETHLSSQSTVVQLTVSPIDLVVSAMPASMLYGLTPPTLTGVANGLLPQDIASAQLTFTSSASPTASPGTYPIGATLSGSSAPNYAVKLSPASLVITRAPATVALTVLPGEVSGDVILSAHVASSTTGTPTGSLTFLDADLPFAASALGASGTLNQSLANLANGPHAFAAVYSGDNNFTPLGSSVTTLTISPGTAPNPSADFTLSATGVTTRSILKGGTTSYTFSISTVGSPLSSAITLAAAGLPSLAVASFNPSYIPPGGAVSSFTMTIATPTSNVGRSIPPRNFGGIATAALLLPILAFVPGCRGLRARCLGLLIISPMLLLNGCGARVLTAPNSGLVIYTLNVSGTATTATGAIIQRGTSVTLTVH